MMDKKIIARLDNIADTLVERLLEELHDADLVDLIGEENLRTIPGKLIAVHLRFALIRSVKKNAWPASMTAIVEIANELVDEVHS